MAKFKFRLATLLRIREATRDQRRVELAEAYRVDDLLKQQLDRVGEELNWLHEQRRGAAGPGPVEVDRLVEAHRFELALKARATHLGQQREQVSVEVQRRRQILVEASREVRVLEKLRQRQTQDHRREENRQETKRLDEVAGRCGGLGMGD